jgi:DNA-binding MltR family transcriptional regulator
MDAVTERLRPYFRALAGESDRGLAILSAGLIDDLLKDLLIAFFVDCPKVVQQLVEGDGPLGTFSSRTKMALCLGFLTEDELADVDTIRKCRNEAAHVATVVDLSDRRTPIVQRCDHFKTLSDRTKKTTPDARDRYMLVAAWLAIKIGHVRESIVRCAPPPVPDNMQVLSNRALTLSVITGDPVTRGAATGSRGDSDES